MTSCSGPTWKISGSIRNSSSPPAIRHRARSRDPSFTRWSLNRFTPISFSWKFNCFFFWLELTTYNPNAGFSKPTVFIIHIPSCKITAIKCKLDVFSHLFVQCFYLNKRWIKMVSTEGFLIDKIDFFMFKRRIPPKWWNTAKCDWQKT